MPGRVVVPHVTPHALDDWEVFPILEILRRKELLLQVEALLPQSSRFGLRLELDLDDPELRTLPQLFDFDLVPVGLC